MGRDSAGRRKSESTSVRSSMAEPEQGRSRAAPLAVRRVERTSAADGPRAGGNLEVRPCRQRQAGPGVLVLHGESGQPPPYPPSAPVPRLFRRSTSRVGRGAGARERRERSARGKTGKREKRESAKPPEPPGRAASR